MKKNLDQLKGTLEKKDITTEMWREYDFSGRIYRIDKPVALWVGGTTHRVLDSKGIVHCVPGVGMNGCVLRWLGISGADVSF